MKRKTRTITINSKKYVGWWGLINYTTSLFLSPEGDKTTVIRVDFTDKCVNDEFNLAVTIRKDDVEKTVTILNPAMSGLLLPYIQEHEIFVPRKQIFIDGRELLEKMGYEIISFKKGLD